MIEIDKHIVEELNEPVRFVDYCIGVFPQLMTKNAVKKAIKKNELLINGVIASTGVWMNHNDEITLVDNQNRILKAFPLDIEIVYEDDDIVVVNKPSGLVVSGNMFRTLENVMVEKIKPSNKVDKNKNAKPIHRLDSATSGLIMMSKNASSHREFAKLFEKRSIHKTYHAIVVGEFNSQAGRISNDINGQHAETDFEILKVVNSLRSDKMSLLKLHPKTGRTHQLRIHCADQGNPIVGDTLYGEKGNTLLHKGLFLCATKLSFIHPITKNEVHIEKEVPHKFHSLLEREERRWKQFRDVES